MSAGSKQLPDCISCAFPNTVFPVHEFHTFLVLAFLKYPCACGCDGTVFEYIVVGVSENPQVITSET